MLLLQNTQARHIPLTVGADRQLGLGIGVQQRRDQADNRRLEGQVEQPDAAAGGLVRQGPAKAPERGIGDGVDVCGRIGTIEVTGRTTGQQPA
ncbi:hypothetical protein D3C84_330040 [compost metagenome]